MPLSRYQIRNEYNLADPDLYKVADKDDPEALLEGVAMAGLVGVLRQLGDLAEFAAEIFHDLHEEVMATAARGHGLIVRVQQLEAEFPLVERTLLSQTIHTAFLYNSGSDWHPNARMDENVVARGDLPRFVMDSYEECRGPPRLFLLDKFDVAGAGACLKRFTDPSFFNAETMSSSDKKSDGQREKRTRKGKRRGIRWRNGDTSETFPSSHAKLHQLFLEELVETGGSDPDRRVKLKKKQFTGSLFDQEKRKSYMEKFVDCCSPEQKIVHEICIDALPLRWRSENGCESGLEIVEIGTVSPLKESIHSSSPDTREMMVKPSLKGFIEEKLADVINSENAQDPRFNHDGKISSAIYKLRSEEAFADRQSKSEVSDDDGHYSDDVASEIDKYMDARATIESEGETDSECYKNSLYLNLKPIVVDSDASEGLREPQSLLMDCQSLGNSTASEDGNNFYGGRQSSSRSISENSLAETTPYLDCAVGAVPFVAACKSDVDNISFQHQYKSKDASESKGVVNSLPETSQSLDTNGSTVPSFSVCNPDADNIYSGHHSSSEDMLEGKTEECAKCSTVAVEADEVTKNVQEFEENTFNTSHLTDPSTKIHSVNMEASLRNYSLPRLDLDDVCSNSAEPDILSEMSDPRHANQTTNSSFDITVLDTRERVDSGDWSNARQPVHGMASCSSSVYSETSPDPETTIADLLQIEPKKADFASSSVEEHISDFGMGGLATIFDFIDPEIVESTDNAPNLDGGITSTEEKSADEYSASDSKQKFNNQEQSETRKPTHSPPDYAETPLPDSERDSSIKEVFANVEDEEMASSAPIFGQTETLPLPVSRRLHTIVADISFSGTTDAAETAEYGSLEEAVASVVSSRDEPNCEFSSGSADGETMSGSTVMENPFLLLESSESNDQLQKLPSETTDADVLEHRLAETGEQYTGNETSEGQNSVSTSGTECKAGLNVVSFHRDAICRDITSVCSNLQDSVETLEQLDKTETLAVEVDATNDHDCSNHSSSILLAQSDSDLLHDMGRVEHHENGIDTSRQVDIEDYTGENSRPSLSSPFTEKVRGQSLSITEDYHQNEEELAICSSAELVALEHIDPVHDASVNSQYKICSMSSYGYPDLLSLGGSLAKNIQSSVIEAPLISERGCQYLESTTCHQVHLLEGMVKNDGSLSHNLSETMIPLEKGLDLHDDESQAKPLLANQLIHTPKYVDRQGNSSSLWDNHHPSNQDLSAQPAVHVPGSSKQLLLESTIFFPSDNMVSGTNQATLMDEDLGQRIKTLGFPVLNVHPTEPQVNLDSPPLPPLPPMQWRLCRFQNSIETQQVQSMTLPTMCNEGNTSTHTSNNAEKLGYSNDLAQLEVSTQPLLNPVSDVSLESNIDGIERKDLSLTTQTSMSPQNGTQILEEHYQPSAILVEPELLVQAHASGNDSAVRETKVDTENGIQNYRLEHNPQVMEQAAVNSHVNFSPSSSVHYNWQPPPGLMAPETRRTWSSIYDGMPTDAGAYANGAVQKKLPRPRNPLIDEVVAVDKRKLRKVERVKPSEESKPEERESFLEQLQLRKVEKFKPREESKTQEGELLEHLQLRKVKERIKKPTEPKSEDGEFSLQQLQLRKVGESLKHQTELKTQEKESSLEQIQLRKVKERAKSEAEEKPEDTESLWVQLRQVSERGVKTEVEQKPEETESPRVQLRKVNERVKPEVELKPEETDSPRVQLRKVNERITPEVQQKLEETESPRVQLRRVRQTEPPAGSPKIEERDSIMEQIRNKSFSLKSAVAGRPNMRPNIQGPRTNLKVAAILEKASTIRQAMAGSDEEDDADSWSDS